MKRLQDYSQTTKGCYPENHEILIQTRAKVLANLFAILFMPLFLSVQTTRGVVCGLAVNSVLTSKILKIQVQTS